MKKLILPLILILFLAACSGLSSEPKTVSTLAPQPTTIRPAATADAAKPAATQDAAPKIGPVSGRISNGTANGKVPANLNVRLDSYDQQNNQITLTTTADKDGNFAFKDVALSVDRAYRVSTQYLSREQGSDYVVWEGKDAKLDIPLKIYELTTDSSVVSITSFTAQINAADNALQIAEVVRATNKSDRAFSTDNKVGDSGFAAMSLTLPQGATILNFGDGTARFSLSADGRTVTDSAPVLPGEDHVVHVVFQLPYNAAGTTFEQPLAYALAGSVKLMASPVTLNVALSGGGQSVAAVDAQGAPHKLLGGTLTLTANNVLRFQLSGDANGGDTTSAAATGATSSPAVSRELMLGVLIGGGISLIGIGFILLMRERLNQTRPAGKLTRTAAKAVAGKHTQRINALIAELAELDDLRTKKKISKSDYDSRRQSLKAELATLMETTKTTRSKA